MKTNNLHTWLVQARQALINVSETHDLEAQVLAAHVLGQSRAWILAHPATQLTYSQTGRLNVLLEQLVKGAPLPYLIGRSDFHGLSFQVSPDVLIPRPETELMIETALSWLKNHPDRHSAVDVGTGSGCIAITLAYKAASLKILAVDCSWQALEIARKNTRQYQLDSRIQFARTDLLYGINFQFDLICANLPYIPSQKLAALSVAKHEPRLALDGGSDGLRVIDRLAGDARKWLSPGGLLLLEIESEQGKSAVNLVRQYHPAAKISVLNDLAGHTRLLSISLE